LVTESVTVPDSVTVTKSVRVLAVKVGIKSMYWADLDRPPLPSFLSQPRLTRRVVAVEILHNGRLHRVAISSRLGQHKFVVLSRHDKIAPKTRKSVFVSRSSINTSTGMIEKTLMLINNPLFKSHQSN
jgi:hypothetical protein